MRNVMVVTNDKEKLAKGVVETHWSRTKYVPTSDQDYHPVMYGAEFVEMHTHEYMNVEQILYALTRVRGEGDGHPGGHAISMWKERDGIRLGIGHHYIRVTDTDGRRMDIDQLRHEITEALANTDEFNER